MRVDAGILNVLQSGVSIAIDYDGRDSPFHDRSQNMANSEFSGFRSDLGRSVPVRGRVDAWGDDNVGTENVAPVAAASARIILAMFFAVCVTSVSTAAMSAQATPTAEKQVAVANEPPAVDPPAAQPPAAEPPATEPPAAPDADEPASNVSKSDSAEPSANEPADTGKADTGKSGAGKPGAGKPDTSKSGGKSPSTKPATPKKTTVSKAERDARLKMLQKLQSRDPEAKIAAIRSLAEPPAIDAAKRIMKHCFAETRSDVRKAVAETLGGFRESEEIGKFLLGELKTTTAKSGLDRQALTLVGILAEFQQEKLQQQLAQYLDDVLTSPRCDVRLLNTMIDELGLQGDAAAMRILQTLGNSRFWNLQFGFRRAIVQATTLIRDKSAIDFLIAKLQTTEGLVQHDIVQYLTNVSGERFQDDNQRWSNWWHRNKEGFTFPPLPLPQIAIDDKRPAYYGIPICAKRIVFVVDTSGSMRGDRLSAAKRELAAVIDQLPPEVYFSMIFYNTAVVTWQPQMVPATPEIKQQARSAIYDQQANGNTATFEALEQAFSLDPEAIYLLSDGAPTLGRVVVPREIIDTVQTNNHTRRVSLHSIGVGISAPGAEVLSQFMKGLALVNWGRYEPIQ